MSADYILQGTWESRPMNHLNSELWDPADAEKKETGEKKCEKDAASEILRDVWSILPLQQDKHERKNLKFYGTPA